MYKILEYSYKFVEKDVLMKYSKMIKSLIF